MVGNFLTQVVYKGSKAIGVPGLFHHLSGVFEYLLIGMVRPKFAADLDHRLR